jgi:ABC-type phosphate transport system auxiliary subunit
MSNATLQQNVYGLCEAYRCSKLPLRELARQVELHVDSFEALRFEQRQQLQSLAYDLQVQANYADEECEYQAAVERILSELSDWLRQVPV